MAEMRTIKRKNLENRRTWHGAAFILEAIALLFFLMICMAILMQLLSFSHDRGDNANRASNAVILAANEAERFSASPTTFQDESTQFYDFVDGVLTPLDERLSDSYVLIRSVKDVPSASGTMYYADISVMHRGEVVYSLSTSKYLSNGGAS